MTFTDAGSPVRCKYLMGLGGDALGRPTSVTDNNDPNDANDNSTVEWTYTREADGDLRVEEKQKYGTYTDRTITTTYDLAGRQKSLGYPSGLTLSYTHDDIGRVTAVNDGSNDRVADTYKGWLLEKRTYASDAYLTHLDDQGGNLSGYGKTTVRHGSTRITADGRRRGEEVLNDRKLEVHNMPAFGVLNQCESV